MKYSLLILVAIMFLTSCSRNKEEQIVVYGNLHLVPLNIVPLEYQTGRDSVELVQNWLYTNIQEEILLVEGFVFSKEPYTKEDLFESANIQTSSQEQVVREFANQYDATLRFILEGKKLVYGLENDSLFNLQMSIVQSESFDKDKFLELNDRRSEAASKYAREIALKHKKPVAIVIGNLHTEWYKDNGYIVKTIVK